ncbi:MAG: hypothetical protein COT85_01635 [Chlamydiae bacterium CG10_big_fil_rev_8_21_14_0_10_42_34]|nr:MAG: hypothetical protein COT85_01635 [Chlamydiae bacterium CG10_big_fil_rev_8_21_14_0_10_42_34]
MKALFSSTLLVLSTFQSLDAAESIRTMAVARTPESSTISLKIAVPENDQVVGRPVYIQFRIDGYALGAASQFQRADEVVVTNMGQTVHVVIDDHPYFAINEPALDPFEEGGFYYDTSYKFKIPFGLKNGMHTVRMFPARSFGESLKGENTFAAINFYVGSETGSSQIDLSAPFITYNEPSDQMYLVQDKPVLLDFYVSNAELSPDGYKVRVSIDGKVIQTVTSWQPFYIYGLKKGRHTVRLELLNSKNKRVSGVSNDITQTITVH